MFEMLMNMLVNLNDDVIYNVHDNVISVDIRDFEGFDDNYDELMRDYDNPEAVEAFENFLEDSCVCSDGDFYRNYYFGGFIVRLGYSSMDI